MSGTIEALAIQDPEAARVRRNRRVAEALMAQSQSNEPIRSNWQGLARLAQALGGSLVGRQADQIEQQNGEEQRNAAAKFAFQFAGGQPTGQGGTTPAVLQAPQSPQAMVAPQPPQMPPQQNSAPPPNIYGRNQDLAVQRDAMLGASPQVLADASAARATSVGQPLNNPARPGAGAEMPGWDAGVAPPTGVINPAVSANAPAQQLQQPAPQAPQQPAAAPDGNRMMAQVLQGLQSPYPLVRQQAQAMLPVAQASLTRADTQEDRRQRQTDRVEDNRRADAQLEIQRLQFAANQGNQAAQLELQRRGLALQEQTASRAGLPQGYRIGADGRAEPFPGLSPTFGQPAPPAGYRAAPGGALEPIPGGPHAPNGRPYQGTGNDSQEANILLDPNADVSSPAYEDAYLRRYGPRTQTINGEVVTIQPPIPQGVRPPAQRGGATTAALEPIAAPAAPPAGSPAAPLAAAPEPRVTQTPGGGSVTRSGSGPPPTEDERRNAGFASRMQEAEQMMGRQTGAGYVPGNLRDSISGGAGRLGNYAISGQGQLYRNAAEAWVRAKLRRESGAVIGEEEMAREITTYFPQPGDSPETMAQKEQLRRIATDELRTGAGRAAPAPIVADPPSGLGTSAAGPSRVITYDAQGRRIP